MITLPEGVQTIQSYPFIIGNLAVGVYGKPTDWKYTIQNLHVKEEAERVNSLAYYLGRPSSKRLIFPIPEHGNKLTSSKEIRALTVSEGEMAIYKRERADGLLLEQGEAGGYASGDCPTPSFHDPISKKTTLMHASRQSLLGERVEDGKLYFSNEGVVEKALQRVDESVRSRMIATISLGIHADNFLHSWHDPAYGEKNEQRTEYLALTYGEGAVGSDSMLGGINLHYVIATKLIRAGFQPTNIFSDEIDTFSDPAFWSQRASTTESSHKYGEVGRNLVLVGNTC